MLRWIDAPQAKGFWLLKRDFEALPSSSVISTSRSWWTPVCIMPRGIQPSGLAC
jgi:hypothetical protein